DQPVQLDVKGHEPTRSPLLAVLVALEAELWAECNFVPRQAQPSPHPIRVESGRVFAREIEIVGQLTIRSDPSRHFHTCFGAAHSRCGIIWLQSHVLPVESDKDAAVEVPAVDEVAQHDVTLP